MRDIKKEQRPRWYDLAATQIPDKRFIFMNHGFAFLDEDEDFRWLKPKYAQQKYSANFVRYLVRDMDLNDKNIVEIGCGRGGACSYFVTYFKPKSTTGLDISTGNIEICRHLHADLDIDFVEADAQKIPLEAETADVVFNLESSHLYPDPPKFLREVFRILRPGGIFCYCDIFQPFRVPLWDILLQRIGFEIERQEDLTQNVAHAIALDSKQRREFFDDMIASGTGSSQLLDPLYETISNRMLRKYSTEKWKYMAWKLKKPAMDKSRAAKSPLGGTDY